MNKYFEKEKILMALGFIVIAVILYTSWLITSFFVSRLIAADPKISASIIGTMIAAFVGLIATIITQRQIKLREIEEVHREKKVEIYQKFITTITSLIAGQNEQLTIKAPTSQELIDSLFVYKTEILLWGSPKVIKSQLDFETITGSGGDVITAVDNLYKAIREDIGLSNTGLNNFELFKIFLKDPDELDRIRTSNSKKIIT